MPSSSSPKILYEDTNRYHTLPLRLSQEEINNFIEERLPLQCTHFDAYRFFTPDALPLNLLPKPTATSTMNFSTMGSLKRGEGVLLTLENQAEFEQPGCIHTNGDLLKWALKVSQPVKDPFL